MFDARLRTLIDPPLNRAGRRLAALGAHPDAITLVGLALGLLAAGTIALGAPAWALAPLLLGRLADGLDGAVARARGGGSAVGGLLDIVCDFVVYGAIPLGFVLADPAANGAAGGFLLASFYANGASFLAFAAIAERKGMETRAQGAKTLYYSAGLLEGGETIALFVLFCLAPGWFPPLAWAFGALCFLSCALRVLLARKMFG